MCPALSGPNGFEWSSGWTRGPESKLGFGHLVARSFSHATSSSKALGLSGPLRGAINARFGVASALSSDGFCALLYPKPRRFEFPGCSAARSAFSRVRPAMKLRLSVYLDPGLMAQLTKLAHRKDQPRSLISEAAIASFLTPDDADRCEAASARRLDRMTRQVERLERDLTISVEALALFIRFWLTITPPLPDSAQSAALAKVRERFKS